jgi:phenylacetate-CoA ligase
MIKLRLRDRIAIELIRVVDWFQAGILKNYAAFTFIVSHAPQKIGAYACYYRAFKEFLAAYERVPAYRAFIKKSGWNCVPGPSYDIFSSLPVTDKNNYILPYPTEQRCLDGSFLHNGVVIDESSGSTGIPYNWVRSEHERDIVKNLIGVYLRYCYGGQRFIVLNTFSMGAWATGFNMALAAQSLGVVKSTGSDVDKVLHTMNFFGNRYNYIINGYPPFIKYLFDEGDKRGFKWHNYTMHVLVGGEGMSEGLRDYLLRYAKTVYSGYGASDLEIGMGGENPLTVTIRKLCIGNRELCRTLFGDEHRVPMVFQYNSLDHYIEIINHEIVVTISKPWTLSPRIRYNIKDEGDILTYEEMRAKLALHGISLSWLEKRCNAPRWYLPFLFVFGRKDSTISVMGANIYPEDVESVVYSDPMLAKNVNSYALSLEEDAKGNPRPCFEFEALDISLMERMEHKLREILGPGLAKLSLDYKKARDEYSEAVEPVIRIYGPNEGPFKINQSRIKKRYIKKS